MRITREKEWGSHYEQYGDVEIRFVVEGLHFSVRNIAYERLLRIIPGHAHGDHSYEIHYVAEGEGWLKTTETTFPLDAGTLYVMGPHQEHAQLSKESDPMADYCVYLHLEEALPAQSDSFADLFLRTARWVGKDGQQMNRVFEELFEELRGKKLGYLTRAEDLLRQMVVCLVRNYQETAQDLAAGSGETKRGVLSAGEGSGETQLCAGRTLDQNRDFLVDLAFLYDYETLTLKELADRIGLGPRQTQRFLKENYGKSFQEMRTEARMSAAAMLLAHTKERITRIAQMVGYASAEHFAAAFREYYKTSPREYRKK